MSGSNADFGESLLDPLLPSEGPRVFCDFPSELTKVRFRDFRRTVNDVRVVNVGGKAYRTEQ